ncbi:MAG: MFS transporter [Acidobacteriaceae bacterium]|nr:MFS transporter [Acidobacteriaceae bacterium]
MVTENQIAAEREIGAGAAGRRAMILGACCCGVFVSFASVVVFTFGVFLKPLAATFHWSRGQVSFAFTLAALTVAICSPILGRLLDRYPARRVILPCTIVYAAAFGSLALLTAHLWHLYAVFIVLGIVGNGTTQLGYARVISNWFDEQRGRALAFVMAGSGLGSMVFPGIAEWLISSYGWHRAYAILGGCVFVVAAPLICLFVREAPGSRRAKTIRQTESVASALGSRPFVFIGLALLLFSFATNGLNSHWAAFLSDHGAAPAQVGFILFLAGLSALAAKLCTGYLLDRFRGNRVTAALLAVCALGFAFLLVPFRLVLAAATAVLAGLGMGAESDAVPYLLTRYFGLAKFGELYGYTWCLYAVAGAAGPVVMGVAFDRMGSYSAVLSISFVMVIAASALFALLPNYRHGENCIS